MPFIYDVFLLGLNIGITAALFAKPLIPLLKRALNECPRVGALGVTRVCFL